MEARTRYRNIRPGSIKEVWKKGRGCGEKGTSLQELAYDGLGHGGRAALPCPQQWNLSEATGGLGIGVCELVKG